MINQTISDIVDNLNEQIEMAKYNMNFRGMIHPRDRKDINTSLKEIDNEISDLRQSFIDDKYNDTNVNSEETDNHINSLQRVRSNAHAFFEKEVSERPYS